MKIKHYLSGIMAAAAVLLSSCFGNSEDTNVITEKLGSALYYTVDMTTGQVSKPETVSMQYETDYKNLTQGFTVSKLTLPDGTVLPSAKFSGLKLTNNNTGWMISTAASTRPEVNGFSEAMIPLFTNVRFASLNHVTDYKGDTMLATERSIKMETGNYTIVIAISATWSTGTTKVLDQATATNFESTRPIYLVTLDTKTQKATISVFNAVFAPGMENLGLMIEFRDIPFTMDASGRITMVRSESFHPYNDNAPNANFPISNLVCVWDVFSGFNIKFDCAAKGGTYSVTADMPFNYGLTTDGK